MIPGRSEKPVVAQTSRQQSTRIKSSNPVSVNNNNGYGLVRTNSSENMRKMQASSPPPTANRSSSGVKNRSQEMVDTRAPESPVKPTRTSSGVNRSSAATSGSGNGNRNSLSKGQSALLSQAASRTSTARSSSNSAASPSTSADKNPTSPNATPSTSAPPTTAAASIITPVVDKTVFVGKNPLQYTLWAHYLAYNCAVLAILLGVFAISYYWADPYQCKVRGGELIDSNYIMDNSGTCPTSWVNGAGVTEQVCCDSDNEDVAIQGLCVLLVHIE